MPSLENQVPGQTHKSLMRRRARKERLERYLRDVTVPMQAVRVRRELAALEKLFDLAASAGDIEQLSAVTTMQVRLRQTLFRLVGVPREAVARPTQDPRGPILEAVLGPEPIDPDLPLLPSSSEQNSELAP